MSFTVPDRIYGQYRSKPKIAAWYDIIYSLTQPLCDGADQVRVTYDIDTAVGEQLDIIGRILVQDRNIVGAFTGLVFECGDEEAQAGDEEIQCAALQSLSANLTDDQYRLVLKAKIVKNNSNATIDDLITGLKFIITTETDLIILDNEDMTFSIQVDQILTPLERTLILTENIIPKPQGVRFLGLEEIVDLVQVGNQFAQCGDEDAECAGFTVI